MSELFIQQKVEKYIRVCMEQEGKWVHFSKDDCGRNREEIYNRVRQAYQLMGVRYSIPGPPFPMGEIDYEDTPYKLKVQKTNSP